MLSDFHGNATSNFEAKTTISIPSINAQPIYDAGGNMPPMAPEKFTHGTAKTATPKSPSPTTKS